MLESIPKIVHWKQSIEGFSSMVEELSFTGVIICLKPEKMQLTISNVSLTYLNIHNALIMYFSVSFEAPGISFSKIRMQVYDFKIKVTKEYVSLRLRVQNAVPAQPCVGKLGISLVLLNFLHCNFRLWFKTP